MSSPADEVLPVLEAVDLRSVLDSAFDYAIVVLDRDGCVTLWSAGASHLFGWTEAQMLGQSFDRCLAPEDRDRGALRADLDRATRVGRTFDERWLQRSDGSPFWASGETMPLRADRRSPDAFVRIVRDMTKEHLSLLRTQALLALGDRLQQAADLHEMVAAACETVGAVLGATRSGYVVIGEAASDPTVECTWTEGVTRPSGADVSRMLRGLAHLLGRDPVVVDDVATDPRTARSFADGSASGVSAYIHLANIERERVTGCFFVHQSTPRAWTPAEVGFVVDACGRALTAIAGRSVERRLQFGEESLRLATDAAEVGIWDLDLTSGLLTWCSRTKRMFGISADAPCSMDDFYAGLHPDDLVATSAAFASALDPAQRATYDVEYRAIGKEDGRIRWVAARGKAIFDERGTCIRALGTAIDVTARKAFEAQLRHSEAELAASREKFRTFAQAMPNHVWVARPDGYLDWFNQQTYVYAGVAEGTLDGTGWVALVHPDDVAGASARWGDALSTGETYETEFRLRRHDGIHRWHIARAVPIRGADGRPVRWIGTNTDIQDQKEAAQALSTMNAMLQQKVVDRTADRDRLWRLSTDVMMISNFEAIIVDANPAWQRLGWSTADLVGKVSLDFVHPDDREATRREIGRLSRGITTFKFENRYRRRDGSYCALSWTAVPDERHIHGVGRDVSSEREAADALAQSEASLRQAQKMEAVGQLTGGLAHDFNNLLSGISGSLELMQLRIVQDRVDELPRYLATAQGAARRAAALTHRLLAFSRRQTLDPKVVRIDHLVVEMEDLIARTVGPRISISTEAAAGLWLARVDGNQLESALLNLCINARDAMPDGGRLSIHAVNEVVDEPSRGDQGAQRGDHVSVSFTDTGCGMSEEVIRRAFDPFFTTKPLGAGTGLGLSMVYGFARQSGGSVRIASRSGEGTTVSIRLPRYDGASAPIAAHAVRSFSSPAVPGQTILVVDDEATIRLLLNDLFEGEGYSLLSAADGSAALDLLQSGTRIDLLITDVGLPGALNGRQLADVGRQHRPDLKVLFITGYAEQAVVRDGQLEPGMAVMTKPFALDELRMRVAEMIENG